MTNDRPLPEWLFDEAQTQTLKFTEDTADDFNADRMLQGHSSCFQKQAYEGKKKKTLVLEDFTARQWPTAKKAGVKQELLSLISKGFDIYVYQEPPPEPLQSLLVKLSANNIGLIDTDNFRIPLVKKSTIIKLMAEKNIPAREIAHIGTANLKELLGDDLPGITISELLENTHYSLKELKEHLSTEMPDIKILNDSINVTEPEKHTTILKELNKLFTIIDKFETVVYDGAYDEEETEKNNLSEVLQETAYSLRKLDLSSSATWPNSSEGVQLKSLEPKSVLEVKNLIELRVNKIKFPIDTLTALLENNVHLQSIDLRRCAPFAKKGSMFHVPRFELKQLESLQAIESTISSELLASILKSSENLKKLSLENLYMSYKRNRPKYLTRQQILDCALSNLEELRLGITYIEADAFSAFLEKAPNLKELQIKIDLSDNLLCALKPSDISDTALSKLETLDFEEARDTQGVERLNPQTLTAMLEKTHNLKKLSIKTKNEHFKAGAIPQKTLASVKEMVLESIHPDTVTNILEKTCELEYLNLSQDDVVFKPEHLPINMLQKLKKLYVYNPSISLCEHVLKHAIQLDEISRKSFELSLKSQLERRRQNALKSDVSNLGTSNLYTVDANTSRTNKTEFNSRQIFKGIDCADPLTAAYRLDVFEKVDIIENPGSSPPFALSNPPPDTMLEPCDPAISLFEPTLTIEPQADFQQYKGKTPILLSEKWTRVPSLYPQEILTHFRMTTPTSEIKNDSFEIQYSKRDNFYYIRNKSQPGAYIAPKEVNIEFLLKVPQPDPSETLQAMPEKIKTLVQKYMAYGEGKLQIPANASGQDLLKAIQTQIPGVGACRHRAVAFKKEIEADENLRDYSVRIITNVSHAFVEIKNESGIWIPADLLGYEADSLVFDENGNAVKEEGEVKAEAEKATKLDLESKTAESHTAPGVSATLEQKISPQLIAEQAQTQQPAFHQAEVAKPPAPQIITEKDIEHSRFKTWTAHTKMAPKNDFNTYLLDIAQGTSPLTGEPLKKILIKLDSEETTDAFRLLVQKQMFSLGKQVYYIDSPDDLICSAPWIDRDLQTNKSVIKKPMDPPGDKLRQFLSSNHPNPALVVNWSNFKADDIVKFNSLLDTNRKADGVDVPENTLIVGLYTKTPDAYNGEDFFSRFDSVITFPFGNDDLIFNANEENLIENTHVPIKEQKTDQKETIVIDLYDSQNWKGSLLGKWCLQGKNLVFEEGLLEQKLLESERTGKEIEFKNAPWRLKEFRTFWQQARLYKKIMVHAKEIKIPNNFKVHTSEGYQWEKLLEGTTWNALSIDPNTLNGGTLILNPTIFNQYFKNYQWVEGDQLDLKTGWIEKTKNGTLSLLLTRGLSSHQWGELLAFAQKHTVKLNIDIPAGVSLPESFLESIKQKLKKLPAVISSVVPESREIARSLETIISLEKLPTCKGHVILTEDIDYAIAALKDSHSSPGSLKIITISECEARHLLVSTTPQFNSETLDYKFTQKIGALWQALEKGKTVILKGNFKEELIDALAPLCSNEPHFWLNGEKNAVKGKLVLVAENQVDTQKQFSFTSTILLPIAKDKAELLALLKRDAEKRYKNIFSSEEVQSAIEKISQSPEPETYAFVKWQSILEHQLCYPHAKPEDNWEGLYTLNESFNIFATEEPFDDKTAEEKSHAFEQKRLSQINNALAVRPFVFIAGSTGVGKSTFIKQKLAKEPSYKVFFENELELWAVDKTPGVKKTLFIDEANIDKGNFQAFEGLFESPPRILIGNTYHKLTPEHKVVFAGNPASYQRNTPELFQRHGGSVVFAPLSPAYLYVEVIQPLLKHHINTQAEKKIIGEKLLKVYQHISHLSNERILISPRELQMMALLAIKKYQEQPQPQLDECLSYAVHMIGTQLVPPNDKIHFEQWCTTNNFKKPTLPPSPSLFISPVKEKSKSFVVTGSRNAAYNQILDLLAIHTLKKSNTANEALKYAGLGGMVLEGEPGVGKSHFVIDTLINQGFTQLHWKSAADKDKNELTEPGIKTFYIMPVSMQLAEKKKLLLQAFDEGAVVIIDEINSSPMMEDLLNDLLMGIHGKRRPIYPGFMIIGTQNPISMEGRIAASTALERRFLKVHFPPYEPSEMIEILQNKGLELDNAKAMVEEFRITQKFAIENNKSPLPTFRDLLKIAGFAARAHENEKLNVLTETKVVEKEAESSDSPIVMHLTDIQEQARIYITERELRGHPGSPTMHFSGPKHMNEPKKDRPQDKSSASSEEPSKPHFP